MRLQETTDGGYVNLARLEALELQDHSTGWQVTARVGGLLYVISDRHETKADAKAALERGVRAWTGEGA